MRLHVYSTSLNGAGEHTKDLDTRAVLRVLATDATEYKTSCRTVQGITFVNQYIIVGTLGQGAFGKVKLVLNSTDMNLYAVKLLSKGSLMRHQRMRPRTASDFQVEAQRRMNVIRLLHHPNIICPFEVIGTPCRHQWVLLQSYTWYSRYQVTKFACWSMPFSVMT